MKVLSIWVHHGKFYVHSLYISRVSARGEIPSPKKISWGWIHGVRSKTVLSWWATTGHNRLAQSFCCILEGWKVQFHPIEATTKTWGESIVAGGGPPGKYGFRSDTVGSIPKKIERRIFFFKKTVLSVACFYWLLKMHFKMYKWMQSRGLDWDHNRKSLNRSSRRQDIG